jgi:HAD superfamily hydrolase (TIGR01509 family)
MIDAVLCELEGVLIDSEAQRRRALQRALADEGLALADSAYEEHCARRSTELAVEAALSVLAVGDDPALRELLALGARHHFNRESARGVMLAPGAARFLDAARAVTRVALVTRAMRREAELLLAIAGLDSAFECIICADDAREPKPSGALYEAALTRLGRRRTVDRRRVIALEDGLDGIRSADAAGVRCIAVGELPLDEQIVAAGAASSLAGETPASLEALLVRVEENAA